MTENTKKANSLKENILDALLSKDTSVMSVKELDDYARAASSASNISTESMMDMFEKISNCNPLGPININGAENSEAKPHAIECLKDTVNLMISDDYKDRLKAEYWQVNLRLSSLSNRINKMKSNLSFETLPEYDLLNEQASYMKNYLNVLYERCRKENVPLFPQYCCCCSSYEIKGEKNA